jgi:dsDNA-specific endonuclease/ATPase MutS2
MSLISWFRKLSKAFNQPDQSELDDDEAIDPNNPFPDPVVIEFKDVLDLHSIPPAQVRAVVEDYLDEARRRRVRGVRIIHGKGIGVQREIVRSILSRTPNVVHYGDAPAETGGWGATVVTLRGDGEIARE